MKTTLTVEFTARANDIRARALAAGSSITQLCKLAGTARATPDRWLKRAPKTIALIDKLEEELVKIEEAKAEQEKTK